MAAVAALSIVILLFSVIVHEVMHGLVALRFGDHTAESAGRLTLNPIPHIDPIGTILLPAILLLSGSPIFFAWAKPVPINPLNFNNIKLGELYVSAAGIASNLAMALIAALVFHFFTQTFSANSVIAAVLSFTVHINLVLGIFNLIPVPPLDGSKVLMSLLPYNLAREYMKLERYGFLLLIILMLIPIGNGSIITLILGTVVSSISNLLGVPL